MPSLTDETTAITLSTLEIRSAGGRNVIAGYAARYNELSAELAPNVREVFLPGSFAQALRSSDPVALFDHDTSRVLGRLSAGTLRISDDTRGLFVEIDPPDTEAGRDVLTSIRRGDVRGQSIRFRGAVATWEQRGADAVRIVSAVQELVDVGPVTLPAYPTTSVEAVMRSLADHAEAQRRLALDALRARLARLAD